MTRANDTNKDKLLSSVQRLGDRACCYAGRPWPERMCDCKYGIESDTYPTERYYAGEQTGCPELRDIYGIIKAMTDSELDAIEQRISDTIAEAWTEYRKTHPEALA